jgi:hypothetical protein
LTPRPTNNTNLDLLEMVMAEKKKSGKNMEVAKPGRMGSREESFGGAPGKVKIAGGEMATFGHRAPDPGDGVWPEPAISVDQKSGYPKDFQTKTKGLKP